MLLFLKTSNGKTLKLVKNLNSLEELDWNTAMMRKAYLKLVMNTFFDTKDIRINGNGISYVNLNRLYETYLYTNPFRKNLPYSFTSDINGDFLVRTIQGTQLDDYEADYSWVHFSLAMPTSINEREIYIYGKYNNYRLAEENRMIYNPSLEIYEEYYF